MAYPNELPTAHGTCSNAKASALFVWSVISPTILLITPIDYSYDLRLLQALMRDNPESQELTCVAIKGCKNASTTVQNESNFYSRHTHELFKIEFA